MSKSADLCHGFFGEIRLRWIVKYRYSSTISGQANSHCASDASFGSSDDGRLSFEPVCLHYAATLTVSDMRGYQY